MAIFIPKYRNLKEKKPKQLTPAQNLYKSLLEKLGFRMESYAVFEVWDRLLGREAAKAPAVGLKGDRLCVEVDSHARLHDLTLRKRQLLKKLNEHFGARAVISDIMFQLVDRRQEDFSARKQPKTEPQKQKTSAH